MTDLGDAPAGNAARSHARGVPRQRHISGSATSGSATSGSATSGSATSGHAPSRSAPSRTGSRAR
ncbi:hypothetical protein ABT086_39660, partial [Streptomyces mirabilis]